MKNVISLAISLILLQACDQSAPVYVGGARNFESDQLARTVVVRYCKQVQIGGTLGTIGGLSGIFGEAKVDEWCNCAYKNLETTYSYASLESFESAGILDEIALDIRIAIPDEVATCISESSVPERGIAARDSTADVIRANNNIVKRTYGYGNFFEFKKEAVSLNQCVFVGGTPWPLKDRNTFDIFAGPIFIDRIESSSTVHFADYVWDTYKNDVSATFRMPLMVKLTEVTPHRHEVITRIDRYERDAYWSTLKVLAGGQEYEGYVPYDLRENGRGFEPNKNIEKVTLSRDVSAYFNIDRELLRGNRYAARFNENCVLSLVEL